LHPAGRVHEAEPHGQRQEFATGQRLSVDKTELIAAPRLDRVAAQLQRLNGLENWIVTFAHKARLQRAGEGR
jgi:hypothetical protein